MEKFLRKSILCMILPFFAGNGISQTASPVTEELLPYGDFDNWMVRVMDESFLLGGHTKILHEVAPPDTIRGAIPYNRSAVSPWRTSNVMARVSGITKCSVSVFPEKRDDGYCVRLETLLEKCRVLGIVDITVLVPGTIYLGEMLEPIKNTRNPQSKLNTGIPFTGTPRALLLDYKMYTPAAGRVKADGFSKITNLPGRDSAEIYLILQKRWEDKNGNVFAKRVGTAIERLSATTPGWINRHRLEIRYGDITRQKEFQPFERLIPAEHAHYCINSKGKSVPVTEVGWGNTGDQPTHLVLRFSSSHGEAYTGSVGNTFWIDNVRLEY